ASGRRFHTGRMTVQGIPRSGGGPGDGAGLRYGLTVTKKVGNAPERSRIKRRLRAAMQAAAPEHAAKDADVVVIGRRDILSADFADLVEDLRRALAVVTKPKSARPVKEAGPSPSPSLGEGRGASHV
ncbi:MAG TPA: ribonuclease P protein component, partial [Microvirga sp.]|nr:ribonuclease P protein component [Microvirga sp.]